MPAKAVFEAALLHALIAIDTTAKRLYPAEVGVRKRYVKCLRHYYWLLEPMCGAGINFVETRFTNLALKVPEPDFADFIYEVFRCRHAHGDEIPPEFDFIQSKGGFGSEWELGHNMVRMPDRLLWALVSLVVLSRANERERSAGGDARFSLGDEVFPINDWWGRESDFRPIAARYNSVRVKLDRLNRLSEATLAGGEAVTADLTIISPPLPPS